MRLSQGSFYNMDAIAGCIKHIEDESVDLIITDPPYGIEGGTLHRHYNRDEDFVIDGYVEVPIDKYGDFSLQWVEQAERILRPGGQIYIVSGYTNLFHIMSALRQTELKELNHIIWKYNFGVFTRRKFVSSHYHILYYYKPGGDRVFNLTARYGLEERDEQGKSLNYQDREDVWVINREYKPGKAKNKNELPVKLLVKMMQYSSNQGDLVCDLFMGGFSTAVVAAGLNRGFVGFEISEPVFRHGVECIRKIEKGFLLPSLRNPLIDNRLRNQGKRWSQSEVRELLEKYKTYSEQGITKKKIIEMLGQEYGRGRFSITNVIRKYGSSAQDE